MDQDGGVIIAINLSSAEEGEFGKVSDNNQDLPEDALGSLAQSSQDLLSCSNLVKVVNKLTPPPVVSAGPSRYLLKDRPILTGCLPSEWADQAELECGLGLPEESTGIRGTQSLTTPSPRGNGCD